MAGGCEFRADSAKGKTLFAGKLFGESDSGCGAEATLKKLV